MSIAVAILLTLLATTLVRVGVVLLKKSVAGLPDEKARRTTQLVAALLRSGPGLLGLSLQIIGFVLFLAALSAPSAPVSVLQPLRTFGILVMAILSVVYLSETLGPLEWFGIAMQAMGIVLLGCSLPPGDGPAGVLAVRSLLMFLAALGVLGGLCACLLLVADKPTYAEISYGLLAGILLGIAYLHMKVFFMASLEGRGDLIALSVGAMLSGSLGGLAVLLWSFRTCRALVVTTINFVLNQVIVVVGGAVCLGEQFPDEPVRFWLRVGGLASIVIGVALLARFQEGRQTSKVS